jgi:hypothetical protein
MAETTNIAWTDSTFNPWRGCLRVSPGCDGATPRRYPSASGGATRLTAISGTCMLSESAPRLPIGEIRSNGRRRRRPSSASMATGSACLRLSGRRLRQPGPAGMARRPVCPDPAMRGSRLAPSHQAAAEHRQVPAAGLGRWISERLARSQVVGPHPGRRPILTLKGVAKPMPTSIAPPPPLAPAVSKPAHRPAVVKDPAARTTRDLARRRIGLAKPLHRLWRLQVRRAPAQTRKGPRS